jgi:translation initiation factor eIF-2B subunit delta
MGWENQSNLILLNLTYDAMPADFVTMIITEIGMVPPSSVPAILREYMKDSKGERV